MNFNALFSSVSIKLIGKHPIPHSDTARFKTNFTYLETHSFSNNLDRPMIRAGFNWILGLFLLVSVSQTQEISPVIQCNTGWEITPATPLGTFPNGDLNGALVSASNSSFNTVFYVDGWNVFNERVQLNGRSTVGGHPTPDDNNLPPNVPCASDDCTLTEGTFDVSFSDITPPPGSGVTQYLVLSSRGLRSSRFSIIHGPYMTSNQSLFMPVGSEISFDWRANAGDDAFDVYAYLLRTDSEGAGQTIEILNEWGLNGAWETRRITISVAGDYRFVFISGTYDETGGRLLGARLEITNVQVFGTLGITSADDCALACAEEIPSTKYINYNDTNNQCACASSNATYSVGTKDAYALHSNTCPDVPLVPCSIDVVCSDAETRPSNPVTSLQECVNQCSLDSALNLYVRYAISTRDCYCQTSCTGSVLYKGNVAAAFRTGSCDIFRKCSAAVPFYVN